VLLAHYYDQEQRGPLREQAVSFNARGRSFSAVTANGVFSKGSLDNGTSLLIEKASLPVSGRVLDLGCGWGPVGLVVKSLHPSLEVVMGDVNRRAVTLVRKNLERAGVEAVVVLSDGFSNLSGSFDAVLLNPPYAAGRDVCFRLIEESYEHLEEGGSLQLVARHKKGGAMLEKKMEEIFGNVDVLGKGGGFRVYRSVKR